MLEVSPRFLLALRDVHAMSVAAYLYAPGQDVAERTEVQVIGGNVDANANARVLRQGSLELAYAREDTGTVELLRQLPFGGYCSIERGVQFADGTVERVPLGMFRVESVVTEELTGQASLTLADRFAQIQDEPFPGPWSPEGKHPSDAIVEVVRQVFGDSIAYHVLTDPAREPYMSGTVYDQDRTEAISDLTQAISASALFDAYGDFVLRPRYDPTAGEPAWTIDAGEHGVLVKGQAQVDRSSVRNGVSVRGQPDSEAPPIYALAIYAEPSSPIRWGGPFGRVVLIADSTAVTTQEQADATARSLLNLRLSLTRTLNIDAVPNPALEPEDVVRIVFPDGHIEEQAVKETHIGLSTGDALGIVTVDRFGEFAEPTLTVLHDEEAARELQLALEGVAA